MCIYSLHRSVKQLSFHNCLFNKHWQFINSTPSKIETDWLSDAGYLEFCLDQRLYEALDVRLIYTFDTNCGNMRYIGNCCFCSILHNCSLLLGHGLHLQQHAVNYSDLLYLKSGNQSDTQNVQYFLYTK